MWIVLAFVSALCLGGYDISKKIALREHRVIDVLTLSVLISSLILCVPLMLSRLCPETLTGTPFLVPHLNAQAHALTFLKSCIVLSSWIFGYLSLKHLPLSVVSPMQATRPMWTLIGALLIFGERLNAWQWAGVCLAIGTVFAFSFKNKSAIIHHKASVENRYYVALALAILIGACSGLYDKYMMRRFDHNAVQVYYTMYQAAMMAVVWMIDRSIRKKNKDSAVSIETDKPLFLTSAILPVVLISVFLVISDNVYMLALRDPDSLIAVVSTIRRGGAVIGFAYGLLFLKEQDAWKKILCMLGILAGLVCLALGSC
jgi:transporter family protein